MLVAFAAVPRDLDPSLAYRLNRLEHKLDLVLAKLGVEEPVDDVVDEQLDELLRRGKKIQAIKRYRELTGLGLKEAKDEVDRMNR